MSSRKNPASNWKVYCLIDKFFVGLKSPEKKVKSLYAAGVDAVQIRYKNFPSYELVRIAKKLGRVAKKYNKYLLVNDRIDVALASGLNAAHLGSGDMSVKTARAVLNHKAILGKTVHSVREAGAAAREKLSYITAGPVFATPLKQNLRPRGMKFIREVKKLARRTPVLAIGGINRKNISAVLGHGASGVCVIRAAKDASHLVKEVKK